MKKVKKTKRAIVRSDTDRSPPPEDDDLERGPFCPKCQQEYNKTAKEQTEARLTIELGNKIKCRGCSLTVLLVNDFEDHVQHRKPRRVPIEPGVQKIIDNVFQVDYEATWKVLHENLMLGQGRTDHGTVTSYLDHAEDNARKAHQLFVNMKLDYERFKIEHQVVWAGLYDEAHAQLQAEKTEGKRTKQITDGDVSFKMAELHPDEFKAYEIDKKKFELAVAHAENFAERWNSRARDLNTILGKMRGGGVA